MRKKLKKLFAVSFQIWIMSHIWKRNKSMGMLHALWSAPITRSWVPEWHVLTDSETDIGWLISLSSLKLFLMYTHSFLFNQCYFFLTESLQKLKLFLTPFFVGWIVFFCSGEHPFCISGWRRFFISLELTLAEFFFCTFSALWKLIVYVSLHFFRVPKSWPFEQKLGALMKCVTCLQNSAWYPCSLLHC